MKKTLKRACAGLIVWIATLLPICILVLLMVSLMNPEAMEFKSGKITSISGSKLEKYERDRSEFLKFGIIASLIISQTAVIAGIVAKEDLSDWQVQKED